MTFCDQYQPEIKLEGTFTIDQKESACEIVTMNQTHGRKQTALVKENFGNYYIHSIKGKPRRRASRDNPTFVNYDNEKICSPKSGHHADNNNEKSIHYGTSKAGLTNLINTIRDNSVSHFEKSLHEADLPEEKKQDLRRSSITPVTTISALVGKIKRMSECSETVFDEKQKERRDRTRTKKSRAKVQNLIKAKIESERKRRETVARPEISDHDSIVEMKGALKEVFTKHLFKTLSVQPKGPPFPHNLKHPETSSETTTNADLFMQSLLSVPDEPTLSNTDYNLITFMQSLVNPQYGNGEPTTATYKEKTTGISNADIFRQGLVRDQESEKSYTDRFMPSLPELDLGLGGSSETSNGLSASGADLFMESLLSNPEEIEDPERSDSIPSVAEYNLATAYLQDGGILDEQYNDYEEVRSRDDTSNLLETLVLGRPSGNLVRAKSPPPDAWKIKNWGFTSPPLLCRLSDKFQLRERRAAQENGVEINKGTNRTYLKERNQTYTKEPNEVFKRNQIIHNHQATEESSSFYSATSQADDNDPSQTLLNLSKQITAVNSSLSHSLTLIQALNNELESAEDILNIALEMSVLETSALETSALETSALEASALETSALETPALETPALETPALETPALETSALETSAESDVMRKIGILIEEQQQLVLHFTGKISGTAWPTPAWRGCIEARTD